MANTIHEDCGPGACQAHEVLSRIGDKWSLYVLHILGAKKVVRFNELRHEIDGISQRMLTVTLRGLERDGLVKRTVYPEVPPRVEYELTPLGTTLRAMVRQLVAWSEAHLGEVESARKAYDARHAKKEIEAAKSSAGRRISRAQR